MIIARHNAIRRIEFEQKIRASSSGRCEDLQPGVGILIDLRVAFASPCGVSNKMRLCQLAEAGY